MNFSKLFLKEDPFLKIVLLIVTLSFLLYWVGYVCGKLAYYIMQLTL